MMNSFLAVSKSFDSTATRTRLTLDRIIVRVVRLRNLRTLFCRSRLFELGVLGMVAGGGDSSRESCEERLTKIAKAAQYAFGGGGCPYLLKTSIISVSVVRKARFLFNNVSSFRSVSPETLHSADSIDSIGFVALVGAGPGHPELLTLRGCNWLSRCDVVLYDGLSNTDMLVHSPQAECICVGKHGQSRIWKQTEIIDEILRHALLGKTVVRLKGGDPAVFARTSEEVDALVAAAIPFEVVPGITAALAAGSYAGIPITHRGIASAVALVTGHEEPGKPESAIDWSALAVFPGTLVIYMGVTTAEAWTTALIEAGKDPATPCAIVRRCSMNDQQQIHCRLDDVAGHLTPASRFRPPVITIVGEVTRLAETMDWFSKRPLHGRT